MPPRHPSRFRVRFRFFVFVFVSPLFRFPFVVPRFPPSFSFCLFIVCFLYRLLRFSFRFPALLGGGFCYSVFFCLGATTPPPPRCLRACKSCVLPLRAVFFLAFLLFIYGIFLVFLPFSISIWASCVSSCLFLVGIMLSPRFRFLRFCCESFSIYILVQNIGPFFGSIP